MRKPNCKPCFLLCIVFAFAVLVACGPKSPPTVVYITETAVSLRAGETFKLGAVASDGSNISYTSSMESVATVDDSGVITAVDVGKTTIIVSVPSAMARCEVTVTEAAAPPAPTVTLSLSGASLYVGDELMLAAVAPEGETVAYLSTDTLVATVTQDGKVKAVAAGSATIRARITGAIASCDITVKALPSGGGTTPNPPVTTPDPDDENDTPPVDTARTLVWSDEFNGTSLDTAKWGYQHGIRDDYNGNRGPDYWGNNESQYYTEDAVKVQNGTLVITADKKSQPDGRTFSSGRIVTRDKFSRTYGYYEARIKTPAIKGMWPAFWMLPQPGNDAYSYGWAANGEIDIMEAKGRLQNVVDTTIHFGGRSGVTGEYNQYATSSYTMSTNTDVWHTYAVDWRESGIKWYVDGVKVYERSNDQWWTSIPDATAAAPFDKPFYIILNLACEGNYDSGNTVPSGFTAASMYVDYVRVYE